jgi:hypothetical protein
MMQFLTATQKQQHVIVCEELCQIASDNATFLSRAMTADEGWIYSYDLKTKQQSSLWKKSKFTKSKIKACPSFSLTSRGLFTKNSSWQAKESIPHTTVMFYGDCVKMCKDFTSIFVAS